MQQPHNSPSMGICSRPSSRSSGSCPVSVDSEPIEAAPAPSAGARPPVSLFVGRRKDAIGSELRLAPYAVRDVLLRPDGGHHRHGPAQIRLGSGDRARGPVHGGYDPPEPPDASGPVWDRKGST